MIHMPVIVENTEFADGRWMSIRRAVWRNDDGHEGLREWAHLKTDAAVAIPRTEDGRWVLVREWRPSLNAWCWQFPGGMVDPGETPEECARRECLEETGYRAIRADSGLPMATSPGFTDEVLWFFRVVVPDDPEERAVHPDEPMSVRAVPADGIRDLIEGAAGRGEHVAAWLFAAL